MKLFLSICLLFPCVNSAFAIRNGILVGETTHSYVGLIAAPGSICSGTLVSSDVVLTAAHCVSLQDHAQTSFRAYDELLQRQVEIKAGEIKIAGTSIASDLALVKLQKPIASHLPRLILNTFNLPYDGDAVLVGYGTTSQEADQKNGRRLGALTLANYREAPGFPGSVMALGLPGQNKEMPCKGDSGSSVIIPGMGVPGIFGVVSAVSIEGPTSFVSEYKKCQNGVAAWIVPLTAHANWIKNTLNQMSYE